MQQHYRDWCNTHQGIPEKHWQTRCQEMTGLDLETFFQTALYSTDDLPLAECLQSVGVKLDFIPPATPARRSIYQRTPIGCPRQRFGRTFQTNSDHAVLTHVFNGGSAENAGLCPQDKIIALGGYACNDLAAQWSKLPIGTRTTIHFFRQGLLRETSITVQAAEANTALLHITDRQNSKTGCTIIK